MAKEEKSKKSNHFFKDLKAELKKVIWPSTKQIVNNTMAVITIVLISAIIVFILDFVFKNLNTYGINKLKTNLQSNSNETTTQVSDNTATENNFVETNQQNVVETNVVGETNSQE